MAIKGIAVSALAAFSVLIGYGCAARGTATSTAEPVPAKNRPPSEMTMPEGPLSTPQTTAELPPEQRIPDGAAPPRRPLLPPPVAETPPTVPADNRSPSPRPAPAPAPAVVPAETIERPSLPQLGPILSDQERRAYNQEIDAEVLATRGLLETLMTRDLDPDQTAGVKRIRAFLMQAGETREQDLARSRNLAERARLLAEDLERSTR